MKLSFTVIALVSPTDDPEKTEHWLALDGEKERLQLFKATLLEEGSFDPIVEGCAGVFHTASPFYHDVKDLQAELLDPAVKGTFNVLKSCSKIPPTPDVEVDEDWFSDPDLLRVNNMCYELSKTWAEEAAWEFVKEKGNSATLNMSAAAIANLINGNSAPYTPVYRMSMEKVNSLGIDYVPLNRVRRKLLKA
ncbi:hypothetical protein EUGRSUZ_B03702 [Eucalyptus grandis]|uniref:Uncharacterized protein n=1 Tax=Eucalyptus grandis TaxID=71139 RepID=A0ACC3LXC3_EUCGR|nr:hypothetical protein EUGRSUZ_B03702 [Eucalyptus grandis]